MKLHNILLLRMDFVGFLLFFLMLGAGIFARISFPLYSGFLDFFLQLFVYLGVTFFCFCNLFVIKPWKEYFWSISFVLALVSSLWFTGQFNQGIIFVLWAFLAGGICVSDYMSPSYQGLIPKKNK